MISIDGLQEKVASMASQLLESWSSLKEVFRIPKKERIEKMKEHEREADEYERDDFNAEEASFSTSGADNNSRYSYDRRPYPLGPRDLGPSKDKTNTSKRLRESPDRDMNRKKPMIEMDK